MMHLKFPSTFLQKYVAKLAYCPQNFCSTETRGKKLDNREHSVYSGFAMSRFHCDIKFWNDKDLYTIASMRYILKIAFWNSNSSPVPLPFPFSENLWAHTSLLFVSCSQIFWDCPEIIKFKQQDLYTIANMIFPS